MFRTILLLTFLPLAYSQTALESVKVEGSALPQKTILELSGLRIGAAIDRAGIEAACGKLQETGLFSAINFRYEPTAAKGYALTFTLADQGRLSAASIDVPGVDESEVWRWLGTKFPPFDRKVPGDDAAQQLIAKQIEGQLGAKLHGEKIVTRMESDLMTRRTILSFQPEHLPRIASMAFPGASELTPDAANTIMQKFAADRGYTDRQFRSLLENNLRPAYEERGFYRVQFRQVKIDFVDPSSVAVTTTIEEGPKYSLGEVTIVGDDLPTDKMTDAANFKKGTTANWTEIQKGIWEMERPVKRTGYFDAAAKPERIFHDDQRVLDLKIAIAKGPLYRFGELRITGLNPDLEARARKAWQMNPGNAYDYAYPGDFMRTFSKSVDLRAFKRYDVKMAKGTGDHTMDITLVFEPK